MGVFRLISRKKERKTDLFRGTPKTYVTFARETPKTGLFLEKTTISFARKTYTSVLFPLERLT